MANTKLIKVLRSIDCRMSWETYIEKRDFALFVLDASILWFEVPFMELLGLRYHLRLDSTDRRTGWYKDNKFMCEEL